MPTTSTTGNIAIYQLGKVVVLVWSIPTNSTGAPDFATGVPIPTTRTIFFGYNASHGTPINGVINTNGHLSGSATDSPASFTVMYLTA